MKLFSLAAAALALSSTMAIAAEEGTAYQPSFDVSLLAGTSGSSDFKSLESDSYTLDTDNGTNIAVSINYLQKYKHGSRLQYELYLAQTETDLVIKDAESADKTTSNMDIRYYHIGGVNEIEYSDSNFVPYVGATIGMTSFKPDDYDSENEFSFGFNGGLKWFASDWVGARFDARAIGTTVGSDTTIFCNGGCIAKIDGGVWWQYQFTAGMFVRF
ncbi:outer membrane beta-barrel protein [Neiella sp. HB171785]|uniref:Outer membrane beta-barrel protein n=1 Tax=Neiella litorisoli TaxID=2771431 RepID=A0A8J6QQ92_9GAMM|nr:outer membrane beta-barrel protein [Neiella litorisoli]MBD1389211.1 outer membrane beta-barrel protein [Neiella litorisoli]